MFNKAALKAVPTPFPKSTWLNLIKQAPHISYYAAAQIKTIDHQQTLVLDMYTYNNLINIEKSTYRVFITTQDDLTLHFADGKLKWLTGQLSHLIANDNCIFLDIASVKAIERFFSLRQQTLQEGYLLGETSCTYHRKVERPPQLQMIFAWQKLIRKRKLDKRHQEECRRIDRLMRTIRPLPKDFFRWIENDALRHSRYIYYQYRPRKVLDGFCTHCLQDVQVTDARHNKPGICPHCGSEITFKAISRARHIVDRTNVVYFQKIANGFVIRYCSVEKRYEDYRQPTLKVAEILRTFYLNEVERADYYYWGDYKNTKVYRWSPVSAGGINIEYPQVYGKNLASVLRETPYQYCAMAQYLTHTTCFLPYRFLKLYKMSPGLEYLVRAKLFNLTDYFMGYVLPKQLQNPKAKNLAELLEVNKYYLKKMIARDANVKEYEIYRFLSQQQLFLNDQQLSFVMANFNEYDFRRFVELLRTTPKPIKTMKYLMHAAKTSGRSIYNTASDWQDYLDLCQHLQYDLTLKRNRYPKNLQAAHAQAVALSKAQENAIYDRYLEENYPDIQKRYRYETEQFLIEVPKSHTDLINEGAELFRCVEGYAKKMLGKSCIVLFLRPKSAPTQPFYTLEISQNHIVQRRTLHNRTAEQCGDADVLDFLQRFEVTILTPKDTMAA